MGGQPDREQWRTCRDAERPARERARGIHSNEHERLAGRTTQEGGESREAGYLVVVAAVAQDDQ